MTQRDPNDFAVKVFSPAARGAMKLKKLVFTVIALLLLGGAGFAYWRLGSTPKEPPFLTVPASKGNIRQVVSSTGTLQAVTTVSLAAKFPARSPSSRRLQHPVTNGQVVAVLDQAKFKAKVEETRANVLSAQANLAKTKVALEDAERTLKRTQELKGARVGRLRASWTRRKQTYDAARSQVNVVQAQVNQAQASMNQASIDLDYTVIRSPVDGIVISRSVDVGQTVAASLSAPTLFTIANDLTKMEVHTNVDEADVGNIREGQDVSFTVDAHPTGVFAAKCIKCAMRRRLFKTS